MEQILIIFIFSIVFIIISSAIVSGSEAALLSVSYPKIKDLQSKKKSKHDKLKYDKVLHIKDHIHKYITSIVILNNVINIVGSIFIGSLAGKIFGNFYVGIVSAILTFLIILFSEIIPKIYGKRFDSKISVLIATPLIIITKILFPLIWILNKITNLFIGNSKMQDSVSEGVIREMAILGKQEGSINKYESELIENVFDMNDTEVYEILVPRNKIHTLSLNSKYKEILKLSLKSGHTRFPVLDNNDEVAGLVNVKDLFKYYGKEKNFDIKKVIRQLEFAPETMKISTLEQKLRKNKTHMAAIFNEYGDFTGIVTLEDIFEELLGEIHDEFDTEDKLIKKVEAKKFIIDASCDIEDVEDKFGLGINTELDYTTLNGFLIKKLGRIPQEKETIVFEKGTFKIIKTNGKQILKVELLLK